MMKSTTLLIILLGMVTLFWTACTAPAEAPRPIDVVQLRPEIQKMEDAYAAAEKAKDAAGVVAYYSDDAVSYNRNEEPTSGKAAIQERTAKHLANDTSGNTNVYKVIDLFAEGNMAVEIGSYSVMTPAGATEKKGYYLSYFQKGDGKYQCVRDMNVSSMPEKKAP